MFRAPECAIQLRDALTETGCSRRDAQPGTSIFLFAAPFRGPAFGIARLLRLVYRIGSVGFLRTRGILPEGLGKAFHAGIERHETRHDTHNIDASVPGKRDIFRWRT